ncbi:sensor histidine kinase [Janthinobacterium aquaticum]|uniref:sensor histidine kinase n=1 Tax=Janthinobacterium sp. FT58W TaxID=2654254 RepID=UPI0012643F2C|nr:sensor histidine kinase [Janthinobacterium sp. FT58W]KAB8044226.1 hypothetical protein GCM43_03150 [Janthinobacterium sp. FT58W]
MKAVWWVILVALGSTASVQARAAQTMAGQTALYHKSWARQDGAPAAAYGITQDSRGMLWFTSSNGLVHFDGARFQTTDEVDGNKLLSSNTNVVGVVGDALWVGYGFGGASVFEHGKVRHYGPADGLPARSIHAIAATGDGTVWLGSSAGLLWRDGQRWRLVSPADGFPAGPVKGLIALTDGSLLALQARGVYRSTGARGAGGAPLFKLAVALGDMQYALRRNDGQVILVDNAQTMHLYDPAAGIVKPLSLPAGMRNAPVNISRDAHDGVWLNTEEGLRLIVGDDLSVPYQLSGKMVYADLVDREGNLWLSTDKGVDQIRPARLSSLTLPPRMIGGLSVVVDGGGTAWIGNRASSAAFDGRSLAIDKDGKRSTTPFRSVTATLRDPDGSVWFGGNGLIHHQRGAQTATIRLPADAGKTEVQALARGGDGTLWVSLAGVGIRTWKDGRWQAGGGHAALAALPAVALHADAKGRIWFSYPGNQIAVLDGATIRRYGQRDGVDIGTVLSMSSRSGQLWIGGTEGLSRLVGERFVRLASSDGAPLYNLSGMAETARGELWLHGADGLVRLDPAALAAAAQGSNAMPMERFDYLDGHQGLPSTIRPLNSLSEAPDGTLWYATMGGVGRVDPARIVRNHLPPTPQIMALKTDRHSHALRNGVRLPEHTDNLQVDFTAAALSIPERVRFRYRLDGQDSDWREAGARRQAFYTNLGPGDYRFEVMAANEDGVWGREPATLAFSIAPSPTQTLWFKLACAAAVLGVLYLAYLARLAQLTARIAERTHERLLERQRIARTLHDTFLQSVQALILRFDLIKGALPHNAPAQQQIDTALDAAQALVDEGRDQVHDLRLADNAAVQLGDALREAGHALAAQHGFAFSLKVDGPTRCLRAQAKFEALAIGKEALLNAARHGGGAAVEVELSYAAAQLQLVVRDHGPGMEEGVRQQGRRPGHWGLDGMRERAQRIGATLLLDSRAGSGTTVTLLVGARLAYD